MSVKVCFGVAAVSLALAVSTPGAKAKETAAELSAAAKSTLAKCYSDVVTCKEMGNKASGMLVFPEVTKAAVGVGGEYGEGVLMMHGKPVTFYSTTAASLGLQIGAEKKSEVIMFMSNEALEKFQASDGWEVGGNAAVAVIDTGKSGSVDIKSITDPVVGYIFGEKGLMADLSFEGQKITKIER